MRRFTAVEIAIAIALLGSIAAVAIPTFAREIHASRFVEPVEGLARLGESAVAYAEEHGRFPDSAPLTPASPPRGRKEVDVPGTWDHPTWQALSFRASPEGVPHSYSFSFESSDGATFIAQARGDLDGDGILSTFEIRGEMQGDTPEVVPGMYVESELE
jgi:type II secretory pathway pseudopilin PulG